MLPHHRAGWFLAPFLLQPTVGLAAPGLNLAWGHCLGEGTGFQNRNFACSQNTGTNVFVGSFILPHDLPNVTGGEIVINLAADSPTLPEWWQFRNANSCRQAAMSVNFIANLNDVVCVDWTLGLALGGIGAYCTSTNPCIGAPSAANVAILRLIHAMAPENATNLVGGIEYFDFNVAINNAKTVGTGSCTGCTVPVCIVLNSIRVVYSGYVDSIDLSAPTVPGSNFISWQGGGSPTTPQGMGCPAATPTRRSTWGEVRSLYR